MLLPAATPGSVFGLPAGISSGVEASSGVVGELGLAMNCSQIGVAKRGGISDCPRASDLFSDRCAASAGILPPVSSEIMDNAIFVVSGIVVVSSLHFLSWFLLCCLTKALR